MKVKIIGAENHVTVARSSTHAGHKRRYFAVSKPARECRGGFLQLETRKELFAAIREFDDELLEYRNVMLVCGGDNADPGMVSLSDVVDQFNAVTDVQA